ncbi:MAG: Laccase domain protein YfiH [Firmicutes bacterium ADurb.Bin193]|nr:MAG: Laccase domain protein YfiH [Firmicutes bacterium ADurb.Bin193]
MLGNGDAQLYHNSLRFYGIIKESENTMFTINRKNNIEYLTIPSFEQSGLVRHAFSTRIGGVSTGETATMNFGFERKDTPENIKRNFELLCGCVGINPDKLVMAKQVHGDIVLAADKTDAGRRLEGVDAFVTDDPDIAICTFHADCVPLFFLDTKKRVIALAHSGWRGTAANIAGKTVGKMIADYGCDPHNIIAALGPSIGVCHFEVGQEVADVFDTKYVIQGEKPRIDLWALCKDQVLACGVTESNFTLSGICTFCRKDLFYSYRGDNMKTGSMVSIMQLNA